MVQCMPSLLSPRQGLKFPQPYHNPAPAPSQIALEDPAPAIWPSIAMFSPLTQYTVQMNPCHGLSNDHK